MKGKETRTRKTNSASKEIDDMIRAETDWKGPTLARLRSVILKADPNVVEEVKWRKPSNPAGVPVWSHEGIVCVGNILKNAVRLTFPLGAQIDDPKKVFNTRLDSRTVRAIDVREGDAVPEGALKQIVLTAVRLNAVNRASR